MALPFDSSDPLCNGDCDNCKEDCEQVMKATEAERVHVVIGLYGMLVDSVTAWDDADRAMQKAKDLCEIYNAHPRDESSFEDRKGIFFAMDEQRENEVHVYFDLQVNPKED